MFGYTIYPELLTDYIRTFTYHISDIRYTGPVGAGGVYSLTPVLRGTRVNSVSTQNRFLPLDSEGRGHKTEITMADFGVKPKKPKRGRSGRPAAFTSRKCVFEIETLPRLPPTKTKCCKWSQMLN